MSKIIGTKITYFLPVKKILYSVIKCGDELDDMV